MQTLGDHLCVVLQSRLGVGMSKVTLHVLDGGVVLHVRRRCSAECLKCYIANPDLLGQWLQVPFQKITNAEWRSRRAWEQESATIGAFRMPRNPDLDLAPEIRWNGNVVVALWSLCSPNPIIPFLALFQ